jgi:uncharacterized membrane protein (DUF106 family)
MYISLNVHGFMGGIYSTSVYIVYIVGVFAVNLCRGLYDIIKYGFEKESNFVCVILSITILASIIDDILNHMQYEQLNTNKQRIQELEKKVYHIENKLDDTRMVALHLQRVFDYSNQNKENKEHHNKLD